VTDPTDHFQPGLEPAAPATRRLTISRSWGRGLTVLGVATLCAIPAGGALAAGHGRAAQHRTANRVVRPVPRHIVSTIGTITSSTGDSSTTSTTSSATRAAGPRVDDGRWWPWGTAVSGTLSVVGADGVAKTVTLQRGAITKLTSDTITVLSADGSSKDWTLGAATSVTGLPRRARDPRPPARPARPVAADELVTTTTSSTTTDTPSGAAPAVATTTGLVVGQVIGVWGSGASAQLLIVHSTPRTAPTSTVTVTVTSTAPMAG
jgi:hypothetical protein